MTSLQYMYICIGFVGILVCVIGLMLSLKKKNVLKIDQSPLYNKNPIKSKFDKILDKNWIVTNNEAKMTVSLNSSDFKIKARTITKYQLLFAFIGLVICLVFKNIYIIIPVVYVCVLIPWKWIERKIKKRELLINTQILDSIQCFVTDYAVTKQVQQSVLNMVNKTENPMKNEWERLGRQLLSGVNYKKAFEDFANRTNNKWLKIFSQIIICHYQQGVDFTEQLLLLTQQMTNETILVKENKSELSALSNINLILNLSIPIIYIVNRIVQPEASLIFTETESGRLIIFIICISSFVSLFLGKKIMEW